MEQSRSVQFSNLGVPRDPSIPEQVRGHQGVVTRPGGQSGCRSDFHCLFMGLGENDENGRTG